MNIELQMLAWSIALGLLQIVLAAGGMLAQCGLAFAASPRDEPTPPLRGVAGRLDRAASNFLATFVFFAAAVLLGHALGRHTEATAWGARLYFWARVVYVPIYAFGIPYLRTLVWAASLAGIVMLLGVLL